MCVSRKKKIKLRILLSRRRKCRIVDNTENSIDKLLEQKNGKCSTQLLFWIFILLFIRSIVGQLVVIHLYKLMDRSKKRETIVLCITDNSSHFQSFVVIPLFWLFHCKYIV